MAKKIFKYFLLFYLMYFLGHFIMSMAYSLGMVSTICLGVLALIVIVFTFIKSALPLEGNKEIFYGIVSGLFMWVFFGEFLEQMEIIEIVDPGFFPILAAYVFVVSFFVYKKYLPVGISFALGHFGCIWLAHSIGIYQVEILKPEHLELYKILRSITGVFFFIVFLFLAFKLFKARSEKAQIAYTLFAFIFLWSVFETLQVFHVIPDYTYYSFWVRSTSSMPIMQFEDIQAKNEKERASVIMQYEWEDDETKELADYILKKHFSTTALLSDFTAKLDSKWEEDKQSAIGEPILRQVFQESISTRIITSYKKTFNKYIQEFKDQRLKKAERTLRSEERKAPTAISASVKDDKYEDKIEFLVASYAWDNEETKELSGYLLRKIPHVDINTFSRKLDEAIKKNNEEKINETLLCEVMKAYAEAQLMSVASSICEGSIQKFKEELVNNFNEGSV